MFRIPHNSLDLFRLQENISTLRQSEEKIDRAVRGAMVEAANRGESWNGETPKQIKTRRRKEAANSVVRRTPYHIKAQGDK